MEVKDKALQPVVDRFMAEAAARGVDPVTDGLTIEVGSPNVVPPSGVFQTKLLGVCVRPEDLNDQRKIYIANDENLMSNPVKLEEVVFHEMGHCTLNLDHEEAKEKHYTIMSPYIPDGAAYSQLRAKILDHLFGVLQEQATD